MHMKAVAGLTIIVDHWLKTLEIEEICQWDVLAFLHHHRDALLGVDHIARLSGYGSSDVASALDRLEALGLVERSGLSQGARLYYFDRLSGSRGEAFEGLLAYTGSRAGRLELLKKLPAASKTRPSPKGPVSRRTNARPNEKSGHRARDVVTAGTAPASARERT